MSISTIIRLSKDIAKTPENYRTALIKALVICGDYTENKTKQTKSFIDRTGGLRSSIKRAEVNVREMFVEVFAGKEYGVYINDGTTNKSGKPVIIARKFMEEGKDKASKKFEQIFASQLRKHI